MNVLILLIIFVALNANCQDVNVSVSNLDPNIIQYSQIDNKYYAYLQEPSRIKVTCTKINNRQNGTLFAYINGIQLSYPLNCSLNVTDFYCPEFSWYFDLNSRPNDAIYNVSCVIFETQSRDISNLIINRLLSTAAPTTTTTTTTTPTTTTTTTTPTTTPTTTTTTTTPTTTTTTTTPTTTTTTTTPTTTTTTTTPTTTTTTTTPTTTTTTTTPTTTTSTTTTTTTFLTTTTSTLSTLSIVSSSSTNLGTSSALGQKSNNDETNQNRDIAIIAGTLGGFFLLIIIIMVTTFICYIQRKKRDSKKLTGRNEQYIIKTSTKKKESDVINAYALPIENEDEVEMDKFNSGVLKPANPNLNEEILINETRHISVVNVNH